MTQRKLSKQEHSYLKELAHTLKPIVWVGDKGVTEAVLLECKQAILHHELMKVKVSASDRVVCQALMEEIALKLDATIIQKLGSILTLYSRNHANPRISFDSFTKKKKK